MNRNSLKKFFLIGPASILLIIVMGLVQSGGAPKKVFYINSYHKGYSASDESMAGIFEVLNGKAEIKVFFLDAKRKSDQKQIEQSVAAAMAQLASFEPDLIIASDDDAVKFIIAPYFKNKPVPVVFCGVNWSAAQYGLPVTNITGMLEVLPLRENLELMKAYYPKAKKLTVISENSVSERSNTSLLDTLYRNVGFKAAYRLVENFEEWKQAFKEESEQADLIYLPTNGAVKGWDTTEAKRFVAAHIKIPVITCDDFMMPYAVYGLTKVAREQGLWAGTTALKILNGKDPSSIPVARNTQNRSLINTCLAGKVFFKPTRELLKRSQLIEIKY